MDDDRRRRDALGSAPTTPGPVPATTLPHAQTVAARQIAQGSAGGTLEAPIGDRVDAAGTPGMIGHFVVKHCLGEGGMGVVYAGEDPDLGRRVAIKLVRDDVEHPAYRERLLREAQAMARLEHANVVKVYEVGADRGRLFVAMELIDGVTLSVWLRERRTQREIMEMFDQVGSGLAAVHAAGLVHRDFKPDNVLVDRSGKAKVADFGLARLDRDGEASPLAAPLTRTGAMMGTPGYMAPEQMFGGSVDARADQYSFCVALREALGGRPLDPKRWDSVPRKLRVAITRGLSYDPDDRHRSLEELLALLRRSESRPLVFVAAAVLVLGVATGVYAMTRTDDPKPTPVKPMTLSEVPGMNEAIAQQQERNDKLLKSMREANEAAIRVGAEALADAGVEERMAIAERMLDGSAGSAKPPAPKPKPQPPKTVTRGDDIQFAPPENDLMKNYEVLKKPAAKVGDPAHLPLVAKTLRNIGYEGIDIAALDRDPSAFQKALEDELATQADGIEADITRVKLGMVARRRGDCKAAFDLLRNKHLRRDQADNAKLWDARAMFNFAICDILINRAYDAYSVIMRAAIHDSAREEVRFVMAIIQYELDSREDAHKRMIEASKFTNPRVRAALKIWLDGTGLVL